MKLPASSSQSGPQGKEGKVGRKPHTCSAQTQWGCGRGSTVCLKFGLRVHEGSAKTSLYFALAVLESSLSLLAGLKPGAEVSESRDLQVGRYSKGDWRTRPKHSQEASPSILRLFCLLSPRIRHPISCPFYSYFYQLRPYIMDKYPMDSPSLPFSLYPFEVILVSCPNTPQMVPCMKTLSSL